MKPLPERFKSDGFAFPGDLAGGAGGAAGQAQTGLASGDRLWEVVLIRHKPDHTFPNGKFVAAHESPPSPSEWGQQGWSFAADGRAGAERRFRALVAAEGAAKAGQCGIIRAGARAYNFPR